MKGVDAGTGGLIAAIQRAQDGKAGVGDVAQICADAALRAGAHSSTIEAMVASLKTDELQRRLDDLAPPPIDQQDNDLMSLPQAAEACGVNKRTARGWVERGDLTFTEQVPYRGGFTYVVSVQEMKRVRDMPKNKGGRPRKTLAA